MEYRKNDDQVRRQHDVHSSLMVAMQQQVNSINDDLMVTKAELQTSKDDLRTAMAAIATLQADFNELRLLSQRQHAGILHKYTVFFRYHHLLIINMILLLFHSHAE